MKIQDFNERLKNSIVIADGAMGSMLHEAVGAQRCFGEWNAIWPGAGAQIIAANTIGKE